MPLDDRLGSRMEPAGARIIPKPFPRREDLPFGGFGQRCRIGKALHPCTEFRQDCGDRGLLKHEFGDQDRVGGVIPAPGEIVTAVAGVPCQKG